MTRLIKRRALIIGAGAAIVVVGGGAAAVKALIPGIRPADAAAADYAALLADVHDDYVNGRVGEYEGWVLSQHELDTLDSRLKAEAKTPATSIS